MEDSGLKEFMEIIERGGEKTICYGKIPKVTPRGYALFYTLFQNIQERCDEVCELLGEHPGDIKTVRRTEVVLRHLEGGCTRGCCPPDVVDFTLPIEYLFMSDDALREIKASGKRVVA